MDYKFYLMIVGFTILFSLIVAKIVVIPTLKKEYIRKATQDISEEEMRKLEDNLLAFFKEKNLSPGSSIWEVADALKVIDIGSVDNIASRARIYERDVNGDFKVAHDKKVPNHERLFDFAHELGHRINKDPLPADRPHGVNKPKMDQLADYTGAALLMPQDQIFSFLIENNYNSSSPRKRVALIRKLSKKYNVSEMVTVRRVNEVRILKKNEL